MHTSSACIRTVAIRMAIRNSLLYIFTTEEDDHDEREEHDDGVLDGSVSATTSVDWDGVLSTVGTVPGSLHGEIMQWMATRILRAYRLWPYAGRRIGEANGPGPPPRKLPD
eukprot:731209-Pyramimonas_sp.AAC.1